MGWKISLRMLRPKELQLPGQQNEQMEWTSPSSSRWPRRIISFNTWYLTCIIIFLINFLKLKSRIWCSQQKSFEFRYLKYIVYVIMSVCHSDIAMGKMTDEDVAEVHWINSRLGSDRHISNKYQFKNFKWIVFASWEKGITIKERTPDQYQRIIFPNKQLKAVKNLLSQFYI